METPPSGTADYPIPLTNTLALMPAHTFVAAWRTIIGEPPAIMLSSRVAMIALLVASSPVAPFEPPIPAWDGRRASLNTTR
jgi:hypothetical protein